MENPRYVGKVDPFRFRIIGGITWAGFFCALNESLKEKYAKAIEKMVYQENTMMARLKKTEWHGKEMPLPIGV
jgi:hypothetical protein